MIIINGFHLKPNQRQIWKILLIVISEEIIRILSNDNNISQGTNSQKLPILSLATITDGTYETLNMNKWILARAVMANK